MLQRHQEVFNEGKQWKHNTTTEHEIHTGKAKPITQKFYRVTPEKQAIIDAEVQKLLDAGIIEPASGPWSSPVVLVKKPEGAWRLCVDYRKLNAVTERSIFPLPPIRDILNMLGGSCYFSAVDIAQGFHRIPIKVEDRPKTAFIVPGHCGGALYQYAMLPFGLCNAPSAFQRLIAEVLGGCTPFSTSYVDDILVFSGSWEEHLAHLDTVFSRIAKAGLVLKKEKCQVACEAIDYLGHRISREGIRPLESNTRAIDEFPRPKTKKAVRGFIGMANYYREHINNFSTLVAPLTDLTKKDIPDSVVSSWKEKHEIAFNELKRALSGECMLYFPNWSAGFTLRCDASGLGIGAILLQGGRPIVYLSRKLVAAEKNYKVWEQEMLAIIWAITKLRMYLAGRRFLIQTDHRNMCYLLNLKCDGGRLARWAMALSDYDIDIEHTPGKDMCDPDALSRYFPDTKDTEPEEDEAPNRVIPNAGVEPEFLQEVAAEDPTTGTGKISLLPRTPGGITREFKINEVRHRRTGTRITFTTAQDTNPTIQVQSGKMMITQPSPKWEELRVAQQSCELCQSIITKTEQRASAEKKRNFEIIEGVLCKVSQTEMGEVRAKVVPEKFRRAILWNCHNSAFAAHAGYAKSMHRLMAEWFWPGQARDMRNHIKFCEPCQRAKASKPSKQGLTTTTETYEHTWDSISIDLLGPFVSSRDRKNKWCLTVIEQFSNYVTLIPLPDKMATTIAEALFERIILVHGTPRRILSDREAVFCKSEVVRGLTNIFQIQQVFTSAYRPNSNGMVERVHRFINACMKCMCAELTKSGTAWCRHLEAIAFAYNSAKLDFADYSPHYLLFGKQPTMPDACTTDGTLALKMDIPEHVSMLQQRLAWAAQKLIAVRTQLKMKNKAYRDLNRRDFELEVGDWVIIQRHQIVKGLSKTLYQFSEPMRVTQKFSAVLYELTTKLGEVLPERHNIARLVKVPNEGACEENQATADAPDSPMIMLEDCAGTAQLSAEFQTLGFRVEAANDTDPEAKMICRNRLGPDTAITHDLREAPYSNLAPEIKKRVRVLAGGYPCQWISLANPERLGQADTRASLASTSLQNMLADDAYNANKNGNLVVIVAENVPNKEYEGYEIAQMEAEIAEKHGYTRTSFEVLSLNFGDPQHRRRSISWIEPSELTKKLGAQNPLEFSEQELVPLESVLFLPDERPDELWIESSDTQYQPTTPTMVVEGGPLRVGFLHINGASLPVWNITSVAWTIRATGEAPKNSGGAIYRDHRVGKCFILAAIECWKIQGLPIEIFHTMTKELELSGKNPTKVDTILRRLAGNAISTGVARALAKAAKLRVEQYDTHFRKTPTHSDTAEVETPVQQDPPRTPQSTTDSIDKWVIVQLTPGLVKGEQWRVARIKELRTDSGGKEQPDAIMQFYESYRKPKDLTKRSYHAVWVDPESGKEIYANHAPLEAEAMTDLVHYEQRLSEPFELEKGGTLPAYIARELRPLKYTVGHISTGTTKASINPDRTQEIQALLEQITKLLDEISPFPLQERRNYSLEKTEGFILGWSRTYNFTTQHLQPAALNLIYPELLQLMSQAMRLQDPSFTFKSIQVNKSSAEVLMHTDSYNIGKSYVIALGDFAEGGEFTIGNETIDIKHKFLEIDGKMPHRPEPHKLGSRYSLIYFTPIPRIVNLTTREADISKTAKQARIT